MSVFFSVYTEGAVCFGPLGLAQTLHIISSPTQLLATSTQMLFNLGTAFPSMCFELPPLLQKENKIPQTLFQATEFHDHFPHNYKNSPNTLKGKY